MFKKLNVNLSKKIGEAKAALKKNSKDVKMLSVLTAGALILTTPTISSAEFPLFNGLNNAIKDIRVGILLIVPTLTGVYIAWNAIGGISGDSHKKAEVKEKIITGSLYGGIGSSAVALTTWILSFFGG